MLPSPHARTQNDNRSKEQKKRDEGILSRRRRMEPFWVSTENMRAELRLLKAECPIPGRKCTHAGSLQLHGSDGLLPRCLHGAEFQQHLLPPFPHLSRVLGRELTFIDFSLTRDQAGLGEEPHTAVCDSGVPAYFTLAYPLTALADQSFPTGMSWTV